MTEHYKKSLVEQIDVVWHHQVGGKELDVEFTRTHGLAIVQLCDEIMRAQNLEIDKRVYEGYIH